MAQASLEQPQQFGIGDIVNATRLAPDYITNPWGIVSSVDATGGGTVQWADAEGAIREFHYSAAASVAITLTMTAADKEAQFGNRVESGPDDIMLDH